jgi:hypothetical protein
MSSSFGMTRRESMSLLGLAAGSVAAPALLAPAAQAETSEGSVTTTTSARVQHIFGYGSLIDRESRMGTWSSAEFASPATVRGIARGWFDQTAVASWSPTYLGAVPDPTGECNGVLFSVTPTEFGSFVKRETGYDLTKLDRSQVTLLDGGSGLPDGEIWYFANREKRFPSSEHPIVQSYVDVCLDGCLEVEATYPLAKQANFAQRFMETTSHWGTPWINDRIYPWRPFVHVPRASAIDSLIQKSLGAEMFSRISLR